eukprot:g3362.t1
MSLTHGGLPSLLPANVLAELKQTAEKLCAPGKGFLASDESAGPWLRAGHAEAAKIPDAWPKSGVATVGLDDLQQRCQQAYQKGARFAKWRNVLQLDPAKGMPTELAIADTVHTLARYASICQSERLVPIVEPEIVPNGKHDIYYCAQMTEKVLAAQFKALADHHIYLEGAVLKPNMVKNGLEGPKASAETIATLTCQTLLRTLFVDDEPRLGQRLVKDVTAAAQAAINAKGSFSLCLASPVIAALKDLSPEAVDWSKTSVFFTGENLGANKSYADAQDAFCRKCGVQNIYYPILRPLFSTGSGLPPFAVKEAAAAYEALLRNHPSIDNSGKMPSFESQLRSELFGPKESGARFAKWRNVLQLDPEKGLPTALAIKDTVHTLARYASICQSEGLVPIVEPEAWRSERSIRDLPVSRGKFGQ